MNLIYWLIIVGWYFGITVLATTWKDLGWWYLIICAIVLFAGTNLIKKIFKKKI